MPEGTDTNTDEDDDLLDDGRHDSDTACEKALTGYETLKKKVHFFKNLFHKLVVFYVKVECLN